MTFGDGTTARLVGWAALERTRPGERSRDSPTLDVLAGFVVADAAEGGRVVSTEDSTVFAALAMVIALGWRLFGETALAAAGLDDGHPIATTIGSDRTSPTSLPVRRAARLAPDVSSAGHDALVTRKRSIIALT